MTPNEKKLEWDRENLRTVSCRIRREEAEKFKAYAEYRGSSTHRLLSDYVAGCLKGYEAVAPENRELVNNLQMEVAELERKLEIAIKAAERDKARAERAEALVDDWLRSADEPRRKKRNLNK